jgi:phage terminase large subunit-like protein
MLKLLQQNSFFLVPKKNSKSSGAAAIMVTVLIVNRRPLAEALLVAPTKEIANIAYKQAWGIIQADAELAKLFHGQHHVRTITHRNSGASLQIKAADTDVITGSKATYTLGDPVGNGGGLAWAPPRSCLSLKYERS